MEEGEEEEEEEEEIEAEREGPKCACSGDRHVFEK